jgi:hypothetical protein
LPTTFSWYTRADCLDSVEEQLLVLEWLELEDGVRSRFLRSTTGKSIDLLSLASGFAAAVFGLDFDPDGWGSSGDSGVGDAGDRDVGDLTFPFVMRVIFAKTSLGNGGGFGFS